MPKGLKGFQKGHKLLYDPIILKGKHSSPRTEFTKGNKPPKHKEGCKCFRCDKKIGIKNVLWKGGITSQNKLAREKLEIKLWRLDIFQRDNFTCQMPGCGKRGGDLQAHHIKRFVDYIELRTDISNGLTLCKECHDKTKGKEKKFEELFISIINN